MSEHSRSTDNPQLEEKRSQLETWLRDEGWQVSTRQHRKALWVLSAQSNSGTSFVVVQPRSFHDRIELLTEVQIGATHQQLIAAMDMKDRRELWWNVRFELLKTGVYFGSIGEPVQMIQLAQRMYDDGRTKDRFFQRVKQLMSAQTLILWTLQEAFDQPPDNTDDDILGSSLIQ